MEAQRSQLGGSDESVFFRHPIARGVGRFLEIEDFAERYQYKLAARAEGLLDVEPMNQAAITAMILLLAALAPTELLAVMSVDVRKIAYAWLDTRCSKKDIAVPTA